MNEQPPKDPREQMEVRIIALLLGEASAFEEAELLEAIKADPEIEAYYEEMRRTISAVEVATGSTGGQAKFTEARRERLQELFKWPGRTAIHLPEDRASRLTQTQVILSIAAALVILLTVAGLLLPALAKSKAKASRIAALNEAKYRELAARMEEENGKSVTGSAKVETSDENKYVARFGLAATTAKPAETQSSPSASAGPTKAPGKPTIYLPGQSVPVDDNALSYSPPSDSSKILSRRVESPSGRQNDFFYETSQENAPVAQPNRPAPPLPARQFAPDEYPKPVISAGQPLEFSKKAGGTDFETTERPKEVADFARKPEARFADLALDNSIAGAAEPKPVQRRVSPYAAPAANPAPKLEGRRVQAEKRALERVPGVVRDIRKNDETEGLGAAVAGGLAGTPPKAMSADGPDIAGPSTGASAGLSQAGITAGKDANVNLYESLQRHSPPRNEAVGQITSELQQQVGEPDSIGLLEKKEKLAETAEPAQSASPGQSLGTAQTTPAPAAVPIVGDAPVLGRLFRTDQNQETETRKFGEDFKALAGGMEGRAAEARGREQNESGGGLLPQALLAEVGQTAGGGTGGAGLRFDELANTDGDEKRLALKDKADAVNGPQEPLPQANDYARRDPSVSGRGRGKQQLEEAAKEAPPAGPTNTQKPVEISIEAKPATPAPPPTLEPLPEISTKDNPFSTFSLNVSDVSFQLAASSLANGQMPDGARLRSEEFINAFDYHDQMPAPGQRVAFAWDRARNPFAHNRELLRFSVQTAAAGREPGQPLNLVLLLDNSGSMERSDRVHITEEMLRVLAAELTGYDRVSVIAFARTPRLIVDGMPGGNAEAFLHRVLGLNPDGGTNLEEAMKLAYATAAKHYQANANNRVILITDGAANLGNIDPQQLRERVIEQRKKGIALDCFGVGWEGYNDNLLEQLSRNGDGRYGFLNDVDQAPAQFASQLAGALQVAAADVKAQVEFNPNRVTVYRQIGYQQHQLTKEQFRDNTVDAAEIGAAEAGNALYSVEVNPNGSGPIGTFRVRYRVPSTGQYEEKEWPLEYTADATDLESAPPAMRLATTAAAFAEWLANSPYAQTVTPDELQKLLRGVPEVYAPDPRPAKLQTMIQEARSISGK